MRDEHRRDEGTATKTSLSSRNCRIELRVVSEGEALLFCTWRRATPTLKLTDTDTDTNHWPLTCATTHQPSGIAAHLRSWRDAAARAAAARPCLAVPLSRPLVSVPSIRPSVKRVWPSPPLPAALPGTCLSPSASRTRRSSIGLPCPRALHVAGALRCFAVGLTSPAHLPRACLSVRSPRDAASQQATRLVLKPPATNIRTSPASPITNPQK